MRGRNTLAMHVPASQAGMLEESPDYGAKGQGLSVIVHWFLDKNESAKQVY